ncbi:MAG: Rieske 2Fe-2S domain-containing protein [Acidimicrobiia bacterium]|nr:Rieske 2Fe-2S domain-containing protein [Acidimicrobiia bacterium]
MVVRDELSAVHVWSFDYLVTDRAVHRRIYTDAAVFEAEMAQIFGRVWVYVGHESEVRQPGDYKTSWVGRQPVIVSRDEDHRLHVLFNRCTHRAATICQERAGTANYFRCGYHGWTFRNDGTLIGPTFGSGYAEEDFSAADFTLGRAARVDSYRGFIFASLSPEGPSLRHHLGNAAPYIDLLADLAPAGELTLGDPGQHHYGYAGNWKLQSENGVDGYHPNFVHQAFLEGASRSGAAMQLFGQRSPGTAVDLGNGHALLDIRPILADVHEKVLRSTADGEALFARLADRLGGDRAREVVRCNGAQGFNLLVFPNLLIIQMQVRVVHPRRVDLTEVDLYPALLDGAPESVNAARLRTHESFYGPAGGGAPGDLEMFRRVQDGLQVESVEWLQLLRGLRRTELGPAGELVGHITDEHPQRAFYRRWAEEMRA